MSAVLRDGFRGGSGGRGFEGGGSKLMRGVDESVVDCGAGVLEGEGVLLDSGMPTNLATPGVSVW